MEETQTKFLDLVKTYEDLQNRLSEVRGQLEEAMKNLGVGTMLQDPSTGIVYQVVKPNGTFIYYRDLEYIRTKKEGERAGSLSVKKAEEAGFIVEKVEKK